MNADRRWGAGVLAVVAGLGLFAGCSDAGETEPTVAPTESAEPSASESSAFPEVDLGRFDEVLAEPFCDLVVPALNLPNQDQVEYRIENSEPKDSGGIVLYVCRVVMEGAAEFDAADAGLEYVDLRLVLEVANDDSEGAWTLSQIPEPFDAGATAWEETGGPKREQSRVVECPEQSSCAGETAEVIEYASGFEALHRNMYLGLSARFYSPAGSVDPVEDPPAYLQDMYIDYVSSLVETLPRAD